MVKVIPHQRETLVKPSLLIVDDDPMIRKSMTRLLKKEGYGVKSVSTGEEVFKEELLAGTDVILLDLQLGKESGNRVKGENNSQNVSIQIG